MLDHLDALIRRSPESVAADVDEDTTVILLPSTGTYYEVECVARAIWSLTCRPTSIRALCDRVSSEHRIDRGRCEADVKRFVGQLLDAGLVTVAAPIERAPAETREPSP